MSENKMATHNDFKERTVFMIILGGLIAIAYGVYYYEYISKDTFLLSVKIIIGVPFVFSVTVAILAVGLIVRDYWREQYA